MRTEIHMLFRVGADDDVFGIYLDDMKNGIATIWTPFGHTEGDAVAAVHMSRPAKKHEYAEAVGQIERTTAARVVVRSRLSRNRT